jgi:hypothetical protein
MSTKGTDAVPKLNISIDLKSSKMFTASHSSKISLQENDG